MLYEEFIDTIRHHLDVDEIPARDADLYNNAGWDSMLMFELLVAVEDLATTQLPQDPPMFMTLAGAYDYYLQLTDQTIKRASSAV